MSLNWNVERVKDHDSVCWIKRDQGKEMNPVTKALIYATMAVELGAITEKNKNEFFIRLDAWQKAYGPFLHCTDDESRCTDATTAMQRALEYAPNEVEAEVLRKAIAKLAEPRGKDYLITYDEVCAHVGMSTNVGDKSRTFFTRKLGAAITEERERSLNYALRDKAKPQFVITENQPQADAP